MRKLLPLAMAVAVALGIGLGVVSVVKANPVTQTQAEEKCKKCNHLPSKPEGDCKCECHKAK